MWLAGTTHALEQLTNKKKVDNYCCFDIQFSMNVQKTNGGMECWQGV